MALQVTLKLLTWALGARASTWAGAAETKLEKRAAAPTTAEVNFILAVWLILVFRREEKVYDW